MEKIIKAVAIISMANILVFLFTCFGILVFIGNIPAPTWINIWGAISMIPVIVASFVGLGFIARDIWNA